MNSKAVRFLVGLVIVFAIFMFAAQCTQAAQSMYDTVVKGELKVDAGGVIDTGAGTLKINGTAVTATAAGLNAAGAVSSGVTGSSTVATNVSGLSAFATNIVNAGSVVTNWTTVYTTNTWYYLDLSTNAATNVVITAVNTPQTAAVTLQTATPAIQQSTISFVSGVCTNKP